MSGKFESYAKKKRESKIKILFLVQGSDFQFQVESLALLYVYYREEGTLRLAHILTTYPARRLKQAHLSQNP